METRARFGIKGFSLNESESGYSFDFEIYCGSAGTDQWCQNMDYNAGLSVFEKCVLHLLNRSDLLEKAFCVTIDNWFQSYRLCCHLLEKNTLCVGTIKANRGVPAELKNFRLQPINSEFARNGDVLLVKFVDKRDVYVMSTKHTAATVTKSRINKERIRIEFEKPTTFQLILSIKLVFAQMESCFFILHEIR